MRELAAYEVENVSGAGFIGDVESVVNDVTSSFAAGGALAGTSRFLWNTGKAAFVDASVGALDGVETAGLWGAAIGGAAGLVYGVGSQIF